MWLVTNKSPLMTGRESLTGSGMIDAFFDEWLPLFVHECRRQGFFHAKHNELAMAQWNEDKFVSIKGTEEYAKMLKEANKKGKEYADALYEEVGSVDGVSAGSGKIGRDKYEGKDKLTIQQSQDGKYMDVMHAIVEMGAEGERLLLLKRLKENLAKSEQERQNLKHILDLQLDKNCVEENITNPDMNFLERKWTEAQPGTLSTAGSTHRQSFAARIEPSAAEHSDDSDMRSTL